MKTPEEIKKGMEICFLKPNPKLSCAGCPYGDMRVCGNDLGVDILAYIQQLEAAAPKWISVEERLPDEGGLYLVYSCNYDMFTARYSARLNRWESHLVNLYGRMITHWTPLPMPPEEE